MSPGERGPLRIGFPNPLPIFPLPGVILLPRGRLPLHIFEPRYLNMTQDALAGDRMIGMVQPLQPVVDSVGDSVELYGVGCVGRITTFAETDDGRILITLTGLCRFAIDSETKPLRGYRRITARYDTYADDLKEGTRLLGDRPRLLKAVKTYFEIKGIEADWKTLETANDETLVTALAMICPLEPPDKQALLESPGMAERGDLLARLLEFSVHGGTAEPPSTRH